MPMAVAEVLAVDTAAKEITGQAAKRRVGFDGGEVLLGDNLAVLRDMACGVAGLIYIDPPFNTGKMQTRKNIRVRSIDDGKTAMRGNDGRYTFGRRFISGGFILRLFVMPNQSFDDFGRPFVFTAPIVRSRKPR